MSFLGRGEEGRGHGDVADVAARKPEPRREELEVDVVGARHRVAETSFPEHESMLLLGLGKVNENIQPAGERIVDVRPKVRCQHGNAFVGLEPLEEVGDLDVGVPVARITHLAALPEQCIRFVEKDHPVDAFGCGEDPFEVLLGLADVLVHDGREVDLIEVEAQCSGERFGRHGLADAARAGEQRDHAEPTIVLATHPPRAVHEVAPPVAALDLEEELFYVVR